MSLDCATGGVRGAEVAVAGSFLATVDCGIAEQMQHAYAVLMAPGGTFTTALTMLLTIYVAILGYRFVLGTTGVSLGEMLPHFIKIGLIVALTTSWPSYNILVFRTLYLIPEQLGGFIVSHAVGIGTAHVDVAGELQSLFDRLTSVASRLWETRASLDGSAVPMASDPYAYAGLPSNVIESRVAPPFVLGAPQVVAATLWLTAFVMLMAGLGIVLASRVLVALLLLVGPCFIVMALFAATRGIFEGWLRASIKFALVPLFTLPVTAIFIVALKPFVYELDASIDGRVAVATVTAILLVIGVFVAALLQATRIVSGIAGALRLPRALTAPRQAIDQSRIISPTSAGALSMPQVAAMSRAVLLSQSVLDARRRGAPLLDAVTMVANRTASTKTGAQAATANESQLHLGQTYRRRDVTTASVASATRRQTSRLTGRIV